MTKKVVISLVGMIGSGKTAVLKELENRGYPTIDEGYMTSKIRFDNRLSISKWGWVANWFNNLYDYFNDSPNCHFVFTDRSAMEASLWTQNCYPFKEPLKSSFRELENMGYKFVTICLYCDDVILEQRIDSRLKKEPSRKFFNEANKAFINSLNESYKCNIDCWDYVIDTSDISPSKVCDMILNAISQYVKEHERIST